MWDDFKRQWLGTAFLLFVLAALALAYAHYSGQRAVCADEPWAVCLRNWIQAVGAIIAVVIAAMAAYFAFHQMRAALTQATAAIEQATAAAFPIARHRKSELQKLATAITSVETVYDAIEFAIRYSEEHFPKYSAQLHDREVGRLLLLPFARVSRKSRAMHKRMADPTIFPGDISADYRQLALRFYEISHQSLVIMVPIDEIAVKAELAVKEGAPLIFAPYACSDLLASMPKLHAAHTALQMLKGQIEKLRQDVMDARFASRSN
jgi:hypothetical protein